VHIRKKYSVHMDPVKRINTIDCGLALSKALDMHVSQVPIVVA